MLLSLQTATTGPRATTTEAPAPRACAQLQGSHHHKKAAHCDKEQPLLATTRESPRSNEDPEKPKSNENLLKKHKRKYIRNVGLF